MALDADDPGPRAALLEELAGVPDADGQLVVDALEEAASAHAEAGRYDEAIATFRRALDAGLRGIPDPDWQLGEYHLLAGRREEAERIFDRLRDKDPDDVWLYNAVGLVYLDADDAEQALAWFNDGLELALRTDDPEELAAQLLDLCDEALDRLDREPEDLHERADAFVRERLARRQRELEQREARDDHDPWTDGDPADEGPPDDDRGDRARLQEPGGDITTRPLPEGVALQLVWIPPDQYEQAMRQWTVFAEKWDGDSYEDYARTLQGHLLRFAAETGRNPSISPLVVDDYLAWCEREGHDPAARESRAQYAGVVSQRGGSIAWPPGRNDPCWCRSGRKYKRCCGTVPRPQL